MAKWSRAVVYYECAEVRLQSMFEHSNATPKWILTQCVAGGQCPQDLDVICWDRDIEVQTTWQVIIKFW